MTLGELKGFIARMEAAQLLDDSCPVLVCERLGGERLEVAASREDAGVSTWTQDRPYLCLRTLGK